MSELGPTHLNIPRGYFYGENDFMIYGPKKIELSAGGPQSLNEVFRALQSAKNPILLCGGGVVLSGGVQEAVKLAEYLGVGAATTYLHNDAFTCSHELSLGPLGYMGSKAAMNAINKADLVLAVGTRLNPFGTVAQYGMNYWPQEATLIQIDRNPKIFGLTKNVDISVCGDAKLFLQEMLRRSQVDPPGCIAYKKARISKVKQMKAEWLKELDAMTNAVDPVHVHGNGFLKPRQVIREIVKAAPHDAVISTDIGNVCSVANGYLNFDIPRSFMAPMTFGNCGYSSPVVMGAKVADPSKPCIALTGEGAWGMQLMETLTCVRENIPITVVVFNNGQWGAEKKNQVIWFGDRYVGTDLENPNFAAIAKAMGAEGIVCTEIDQVGDAVKKGVEDQMRHQKTTVIEVIMTRELGDAFRPDAMKLPKRILKKYKSTEMITESSTQQPINVRSQ